MSKVLWLIGRNEPLGHHSRYSDKDVEQRAVFGNYSKMHSAEKHLDRTAQTIVTALTQDSVVELVAREWHGFSSNLRVVVRTIANSGNYSGNVRKGVMYLDQLLKGDLLKKQTGPTERVIRTDAQGELVRDTRRINVAAAGASRAHAAYVRPENYEQLSASEKKRISKELAAARRADRQPNR